MNASHRNSPLGASTGGVTASAAAPTTQTGISSAGDVPPLVGPWVSRLATVPMHVTVGRDRPQSNAGYANPTRREANGKDTGVTLQGGEQPRTLPHRAGCRPAIASGVTLFCVPTAGRVPFRDHGGCRRKPPARERADRTITRPPVGTSPFVLLDRPCRQAVDRACVLRIPSTLPHQSASVASIILKHRGLTRCGQSKKAFGR